MATVIVRLKDRAQILSPLSLSNFLVNILLLHTSFQSVGNSESRGLSLLVHRRLGEEVREWSGFSLSMRPTYHL